MRYTPHPFQAAAIDHGVASLLANTPAIYAAPTGCGKSVIELSIQERLAQLGHDPWIVSPRTEILDGMLDKLGATGDPMSHRLSTPIMLRNRLLDGRIRHPSHMILDEGHHQTAETWQQLDLLSGLCPSIAFTATPYRGSPAGTRALLERWGEPVWIISWQEAAESGYIKMPTFTTLPLVDDDCISVTNGEFAVESIDSATLDRLGDLAEQSRQWYSGSWTLPTIFACPSTACVRRLHAELSSRGLPCAAVTADTKRDERTGIFEACEAGVLALLHINVVSEGLDLRVRRLIDLAPTMSPVRWVQQVGRIMRPTELQPEYFACCRNLLRHSYALDGAVPLSSIVEAERVFPPSERQNSRVLGLEAIGRFKPNTVKLLNGLTASVYCLSVPVGTTVVEYACVVWPAAADPLWAARVDTVAEGVRTYGRWKPCGPPASLSGFASKPASALSPKQQAWWTKSAAYHGLDPEQELTRRSFTALPVLADLGVRIR